ncbi:hypothetical protein [Nonomuraea candida]|uniref:hypothetical protein n=1 Tax=Nonomuraea candida TaxID=359159 RepID=UPI0012F90323|nr:hypothetical protein [Nonomuraea candida]
MTAIPPWGRNPAIQLKTYTVTTSGREREDGEAPYTWVLDASHPDDAKAKGLIVHLREALGIDLTDLQSVRKELAELQIEEIYEGLPLTNCRFHWNDMRRPG